jgi:hypothetical protein
MSGKSIKRRPRNRWWNCVQTDMNKCKITNEKGEDKNTADWEKTVKKKTKKT